MTSVLEAAERQGFPESAQHLEYFSVPELPDFVNYDFNLKLIASGKEFFVPMNKSAADILNENGFTIDIKCSDGICGVCKCGLVSGDVEHRDYVLSNAQREGQIILCQSRATKNGGVIEINL
jgi:ferredoxin